jgi:murein DD-endopeptidase MepM/ murein hydrolase activator NlpD
MQKLSFILIGLIFFSSCANIQTRSELKSMHSTTNDGENFNPILEEAKLKASESVTVDKENNSIKIEPKDKTEAYQNNIKSSKKLKPLFDWPVWEARMTRGFLPQGTKKRRRPHKGIDLASKRGSAVMASHDGIVIYTGSAFKGYGKMIMIESIDPRDGGNWATLYAHLDKILVYEGKSVRQGEVIGSLGNTGRSSGPHLHFEIRRLNGPIDPLPMLPAGEALTNDVDNGAIEE